MPLAAQHGIQNYTGTAEQNNLLLSKLTAGGASAGNLPPGSLPKEGTADAGGITPTGTDVGGNLANLRIALRTALNEAGRNRVARNYQQVAPLSQGVPGTIGSVVDMIRSGVKSPIETTFSDIMAGYKDATELQRKELDRINDLRLEFGSAVPANVTDLKTALSLVAPLVDRERKVKLDKLAQDQIEDEDIETWAQGLADGTYKPGNIPAKIRTRAVVRADVLRKDLEVKSKEEYKSKIAFRLERKTSNFEVERSLVVQDDNLNVAEQREIIDYIDSLEQQEKASKKAGGKGLFNFLNPQPDTTNPLNVPLNKSTRL